MNFNRFALYLRILKKHFVSIYKTIEEVSADDYDALAIPGGFEEFGFYEEAYNEKLLDLIRQFNSQRNGLQQSA